VSRHSLRSAVCAKTRVAACDGLIAFETACQPARAATGSAAQYRDNGLDLSSNSPAQRSERRHDGKGDQGAGNGVLDSRQTFLFLHQCAHELKHFDLHFFVMFNGGRLSLRIGNFRRDLRTLRAAAASQLGLTCRAVRRFSANT
jgi:hypothetical protein